MRKSTVPISFNNSMLTVKQQVKAKPFGAHFTTRLSGVNSKLVCALSRMDDDTESNPPGPGTCTDDG